MEFRLPTTVAPSRYDLRLEPDLDAATFRGEEVISVTVEEPVTEIVLNAAELVIESVAAEHAARMTAMDSATNNASDMIDSLTLTMNRVRQASITKEIIEIVSGAAAL